MPNENEYRVEGYGERKPYDSDYHPDAELNPHVHYAYGGNPELQAKWQDDLNELKAAKEKAAAKAESPNRPPQEPKVLAQKRAETGKQIGKPANSKPAKKTAVKKA